MTGEAEGTELSTDEELEGGGAVTVDDDPEEEEEVDAGMGAAAAAAGLAGTSRVSVPSGLTGALDICLESSALAAAEVLDAASGRTAVPGNKKINRCLQSLVTTTT